MLGLLTQRGALADAPSADRITEGSAASEPWREQGGSCEAGPGRPAPAGGAGDPSTAPPRMPLRRRAPPAPQPPGRRGGEEPTLSQEGVLH